MRRNGNLNYYNDCAHTLCKVASSQKINGYCTIVQKKHGRVSAETVRNIHRTGSKHHKKLPQTHHGISAHTHKPMLLMQIHAHQPSRRSATRCRFITGHVGSTVLAGPSSHRIPSDVHCENCCWLASETKELVHHLAGHWPAPRYVCRNREDGSLARGAAS